MNSPFPAIFGLLLSFSLGAIGGGCDWMTPLDGKLLLSHLSIPGTHDAGARFEPFPGTARCQTLTISEQLEAGVRFLDIRCRHINDGFAIHHGPVYQKISFTDVLNATDGFLDANPAETVIMSVMEEYQSENNTRPFEATFDSYVSENPKKWLLADNIPNLDEARGKIVLFRRFAASRFPKGIDASKWPNNTVFSTGNRLRVQDRYVVDDSDAKWESILNTLNQARRAKPDILFVNFASGYKPGLLGIPDIPAISKDINPRLVNFFKANPNGRFGVIVMDFVDTSTAGLIYQSNTPAVGCTDHQTQGSPDQR